MSARQLEADRAAREGGSYATATVRVYATANVLAVAREDGYPGVLENDVAAAIAGGLVERGDVACEPPLRGGAARVSLRGGCWLARVVDDGVSPSGFPCWLVVHVQKNRRGSR